MSMNLTDLYGLPSDLSVVVQPTSVPGPTQGSVVPPGGKMPPTQMAGGSQPSMAFSWVGLAILLIAWRILYEMAK